MEAKAREFWIDPDENWDDAEITVGIALKEHPRQGPLQWQSSLIHVIECSAYEKLKKRVEELEASQIHTCHDDCQRLECAQRRKIEGLEAENKKMREALCYIKEYWNGTYTGDFASYTIDACSEALGEVGE